MSDCGFRKHKSIKFANKDIANFGYRIEKRVELMFIFGNVLSPRLFQLYPQASR